MFNPPKALLMQTKLSFWSKSPHPIELDAFLDLKLDLMAFVKHLKHKIKDLVRVHLATNIFQ